MLPTGFFMPFFRADMLLRQGVVRVAQSLPAAGELPFGEGVPDLPVAPAALSKYRRVLY
jgi:hypothetical protein